MNNTRILILVCCCLWAGTVLGQADTLHTRRTFMHSSIWKGAYKLRNAEIRQAFAGNRVAARKTTLSRIFLPTGLAIAAGGGYFLYDGLRGRQDSVPIDGKPYEYTVRSLPKVLIGLAGIVLGGSLMESSNELKANAVKVYNEQLRIKKTKVTYQIGMTPDGRIGFRANF